MNFLVERDESVCQLGVDVEAGAGLGGVGFGRGPPTLPHGHLQALEQSS